MQDKGILFVLTHCSSLAYEYLDKIKQNYFYVFFWSILLSVYKSY